MPEKKKQPDINDVIGVNSIGTKILNLHLEPSDVANCALVNKTWYSAVKKANETRKLELNVKLCCNELKNSMKNLKKYINDNYSSASEIVIRGFSKGEHIPSKFYDTLFTSKLKVRRLIFSGKTRWDSCHCPDKTGANGEQYDTIKPSQLTNIEYIHVSATVRISACALLDLISRSPKLKTLRFYGCIIDEKGKHTEKFKSKRFYCDMDRVYWPQPNKSHLPSLMIIVRRNENITTLYSSAETTCDLLAADILNNLRFLSLNINERWDPQVTKGKAKKSKLVQKINYLSLAKKLEALEIRTFSMEEEDYSSDTPDSVKKEWSISTEICRNAFWCQVSKLQNLKFLAVYGSWEFDKTCREIVKNGLQIEFLKLNLLPQAMAEATMEGEDNLTLSIAGGMRTLRKLPGLRSLHYICCEKLCNIDEKTCAALKECIDLFWALELKVSFTDEVEELLQNIMKRGNQTAKSYNIYLHLMTSPDNSNVLINPALRFPIGSNLREKLSCIADGECSQRYGKNHLRAFQIWGLEQAVCPRDRQSYEKLAARWKFYNDKFVTNYAHV